VKLINLSKTIEYSGRRAQKAYILKSKRVPKRKITSQAFFTFAAVILVQKTPNIARDKIIRDSVEIWRITAILSSLLNKT
jgi:hypothetical protein